MEMDKVGFTKIMFGYDTKEVDSWVYSNSKDLEDMSNELEDMRHKLNLVTASRNKLSQEVSELKKEVEIACLKEPTTTNIHAREQLVIRESSRIGKERIKSANEHAEKINKQSMENKIATEEYCTRVKNDADAQYKKAMDDIAAMKAEATQQCKDMIADEKKRQEQISHDFDVNIAQKREDANKEIDESLKSAHDEAASIRKQANEYRENCIAQMDAHASDVHNYVKNAKDLLSKVSDQADVASNSLMSLPEPPLVSDDDITIRKIGNQSTRDA